MFGHSKENDQISLLAWHLLRVTITANLVQDLTAKESKQVL